VFAVGTFKSWIGPDLLSTVLLAILVATLLVSGAFVVLSYLSSRTRKSTLDTRHLESEPLRRRLGPWLENGTLRVQPELFGTATRTIVSGKVRGVPLRIEYAAHPDAHRLHYYQQLKVQELEMQFPNVRLGDLAKVRPELISLVDPLGGEITIVDHTILWSRPAEDPKNATVALIEGMIDIVQNGSEAG